MLIHTRPPMFVRISPARRVHLLAVEVRFDGLVPVGLGRRDDLGGDLATVVRWEGR